MTAEFRFTASLRGRVPVSGSKNASLPVLAATLLTDDECVIKNVPQLDDVRVLLSLLRKLGKKVSFRKNTAVIKGRLGNQTLPEKLVRKLRASVLVMGPVLARSGRGIFALPGGCALGERPIDIHLEGLRAFGARYSISGGRMKFVKKPLTPAVVKLPFPSVGATENILMAASLIRGRSVISNPAKEPEITDLCAFLRAMGARVKSRRGEYIVEGAENLHGAEFTVMPDRIEAGTFLLAAASVGGEIEVTGAKAGHIGSLIRKIEDSGASVSLGADSIHLKAARRPVPVNVNTAPYPGFPTDLQPLWAVYMLRAAGESRITDRIFPSRFMYVDEIKRLGADMELKNAALTVRNSPLSGGHLIACDLRAAAAMATAGMMSRGTTVLGGLGHLFRGYENFFEKLQMLGANVSIKQYGVLRK